MSESQSLSLADGLRQTQLTYPELWVRYVALGGDGSVDDVRRHVESERCPDDSEHNMIAQALNDTYLERGYDHPVAYRHVHRPQRDE